MQFTAGLPNLRANVLQIRTPFEAQTGRGFMYRSGAVTTSTTASHGPLIRGGAAAAALLVLIMSASAARLTIDGLRSKTRAPAMALRAKRPPRGRKPPAAFLSGRKTARLRLVVQAWAYAHPRLLRALEIFPLRELNQPALGTGSLIRSARWTAIGGHGRHGPG